MQEAVEEILKRQRAKRQSANVGAAGWGGPASAPSVGTPSLGWDDPWLTNPQQEDQPYASNQPHFGGVVDRSLANPSDVDQLMEIDWKLQRKRQQWEKAQHKDWPWTADGRRYHGHHPIPKAYGGSDGLDNFEPMDPLEHRKHHMENDDFRTWGSWAGGKKPKGPDVKGLGLLGIIPDITGILSGRIRTDTFDNFTSDLMGVPSEEDRRRAFEEEQRRLNPKWKPGDPFVI